MNNGSDNSCPLLAITHDDPLSEIFSFTNRTEGRPSACKVLLHEAAAPILTVNSTEGSSTAVITDSNSDSRSPYFQAHDEYTYPTGLLEDVVQLAACDTNHPPASCLLGLGADRLHRPELPAEHEYKNFTASYLDDYSTHVDATDNSAINPMSSSSVYEQCHGELTPFSCMNASLIRSPFLHLPSLINVDANIINQKGETQSQCMRRSQERANHCKILDGKSMHYNDDGSQCSKSVDVYSPAQKNKSSRHSWEDYAICSKQMMCPPTEGMVNNSMGWLIYRGAGHQGDRQRHQAVSWANAPESPCAKRRVLIEKYCGGPNIHTSIGSSAELSSYSTRSTDYIGRRHLQGIDLNRLPICQNSASSCEGSVALKLMQDSSEKKASSNSLMQLAEAGASSVTLSPSCRLFRSQTLDVNPSTSQRGSAALSTRCPLLGKEQEQRISKFSKDINSLCAHSLVRDQGAYCSTTLVTSNSPPMEYADNDWSPRRKRPTIVTVAAADRNNILAGCSTSFEDLQTMSPPGTPNMQGRSGRMLSNWSDPVFDSISKVQHSKLQQSGGISSLACKLKQLGASSGDQNITMKEKMAAVTVQGEGRYIGAAQLSYRAQLRPMHMDWNLNEDDQQCNTLIK
ncbi:hypothetical protein GOP47_0013649 [Adiantum capillus-veneris]|uniref:Uncharacterized protein n=1 Tax=Adiantum capillus-veneris TaxID=13818 RepID=A0A9D4UNX6_ADICA|nr:hypothetical protein GOP47_0013649 [Adiantum capillus-veneris]